MYCRIPSAHAANGITKANKMYSVYSTTLRIGGEKIRGGTTVAATRPSAAMPSAAPAPTVTKCPGAQDENGGDRSEYDQLRPFPLAVRGHGEPRSGHRHGGDADQY